MSELEKVQFNQGMFSLHPVKRNLSRFYFIKKQKHTKKLSDTSLGGNYNSLFLKRGVCVFHHFRLLENVGETPYREVAKSEILDLEFPQNIRNEIDKK